MGVRKEVEGDGRPACVREVESWAGVIGDAIFVGIIVLSVSQDQNVSIQKTPFVNVDLKEEVKIVE
jgi:hypothetical protein